VDMHATESPIPTATRLTQPVIVGHRGAPAYRPEHTRASFELAIAQGADFIEPDVVVSKDGVLVVRHENELSHSTDIASHPEFAHLRTTKEVGDRECTGWFAEDLTLAELRTLRAVERLPQLRPLNTAYDGTSGILTFTEVVELARDGSEAGGRTVRVLAELKKPTWSATQGLPMTELVAAELRQLHSDTQDGTVVVQSFDAEGLRELRTDLGDAGPTILQLINDTREMDHMVTPAGLRAISTYAQGIAPSRHRIILRGDDQAVTGVSDLVEHAHHAGLIVVPWTIRAENAFLPRDLRRGTDPSAIGDVAGEARMLLDLGVDGLITDSPDLVQRVRTELLAAA
jgi:glycerophosphoryl diester phosphodiesterase